MYFWRIEKLKIEMASRPLTERVTLPYVVISAMLVAAIGYVPFATFNLWDGLGAAWSIALAALGTLYIYRQNGGAEGRHFLQRYLAIGWVVTVRWIVGFAAATAAFFTALTVSGAEIHQHITWYDFLILVIDETILYLRSLIMSETLPKSERPTHAWSSPAFVGGSRLGIRTGYGNGCGKV